MFHCVVHPDAVAKLSSAQKQNTSTTTNSQTDTSTTDRLPHFIPVQSTSASATSTGVQPPSTEQHSTPPTNAPPQQGHPQQPYSISIQGQLPQATQAAIQQTITQLNAQPPTLPSIQVLPIQYQALLINGLPFLAQINRPPHIRLSSDTVIPVTTHEGQQALILSPQGVSSLAQQGYQVEIRVFNRQTGQPAGGVPAGIVGQNQGQQQGQRFGLTDFVSLFRRRLGQQLWLMCKLAFMVGVFSSNNASWRRIAVLCLAAAGIFCTIRRLGSINGSLANRRVRTLGAPFSSPNSSSAGHDTRPFAKSTSPQSQHRSRSQYQYRCHYQYHEYKFNTSCRCGGARGTDGGGNGWIEVGGTGVVCFCG